MASNTGSANPAEPTISAPIAPVADGRLWGITTASTKGTSGSGTTANGKGSDFGC